MNRYEHIPQKSLPRNLHATHCSSPLQSQRHPRSRYSKTGYCAAKLKRSEKKTSEDCQILHMAKKKSRKVRASRSLSAIRNGPLHHLKKGNSREFSTEEAESEILSWKIIDREIFEWQFVCQTGRPYWWLPESKYTRLKKFQPSLGTKTRKLWEIDERPRSEYARQRRAASEGYLADATKVHDLAHLVAIQLLSACFTLPPDIHTSDMPSSSAEFTDRSDVLFRDPALISSLRMHSHFRYSPCFGHQPRNSSPAHLWSGSYDGTSQADPAEGPAGHRTLGIRPISSRRKRKHRAFHPRDEQISHFSVDGNNASISPSHSVPSDIGSNYRRQPVIRSESYHVFVQPVRKLAMKRWKSLKRRMSDSLHTSLQARVSEETSPTDSLCAAFGPATSKIRRKARERGDIDSTSCESITRFNSPASISHTPSGSGAPIPYSVIPETLGGIPQITTASSAPADPTPYSMERSSVNSSPGSSEEQLDFLSLSFPSRPSTPTPFATKKQRKHNRSMLSEVYTTDDFLRKGAPPWERSTLSAVGSALGSPMGSFQEFFMIDESQPVSSALPRSPSKPSIRSRNKRYQSDSGRSEICTPDDFFSNAAHYGERSIRSVAGSSFPSPTANLLPLSMTVGNELATPSSVKSAPLSRRTSETPRFSSLSISGTQIFTPNEGIELYGVPAGPPKET